MQVFLCFLAVISTCSYTALSYSLSHRTFSRYLRKSHISLSINPEQVIPSKMSKNKVKTELTEIDYDVTRASGFVLQGTLSHPKEGGVKGPVVIFVHGTMSSKDHNFVPDVCKKLVQDHGIRSYRFNSRFDKSEFEPEHRYKFSGYADDIDDLKTVIKHLRADGFTPFCLFGHSRGANDVLIYSSKFSKLVSTADVEENVIVSVNYGKSDITENAVTAKLPKNSKEIEDEKEPVNGEVRPATPTSITTLASTAQLTDLNEQIESLTIEKGCVILSDKEAEKEVLILKEPASTDDNLHILVAEELVIVVAAPRFNMPKMLTTLFTSEQIALLDGEDAKFEWSSSEKGDLFVTKDDANVVLNELDMSRVLTQIPSAVPILLLHGTDDELISPEDAQSYKDSRKSIDLTIIEGARHAFRGKKQLKQFVTVTTDWIESKYRTRF